MCSYKCSKCSDYANLILEKGEATIPGDGTALISFTDRRDVARYVAYVLTTLPPTRLANREFRIEGQRAVRPFSLSGRSIKADFS